MPHITFVHGISNQPPAETLLEIWGGALAGAAEPVKLRDLGVTSAIVYWADLLYEKPELVQPRNFEAAGRAVPEGLDAAANVVPVPRNAEEAAFLARLRAKMESVPGGAVPPSGDGGGGALERVPLPWIVKKPFLNVFLRDVHHYLFDVEFALPGKPAVHIQQAIRKRFVEALAAPASDGPHVVVAHSLGSVIAYDCLKRVTDSTRVDGLITIGSPLGLDEIQDKLQPGWSRDDGFPHEKLAGEWVNLFDWLDPVCGLDPNLANDYRKDDEELVDDVRVSNPGTWRHHSTSYLEQPQFCSALRRLLGLTAHRAAVTGQERVRPTPAIVHAAAAKPEAEAAKAEARPENQPAKPTLDELREQAKEALGILRGACAPQKLEEIKPLVEGLKAFREYKLMGQLAEALSRRDPADVKMRRLHAQCLIEKGEVTAAIDVLLPLTRLRPNTFEYAEAQGLLGRAYKQIFCEMRDKGSDHGLNVLKQAIEAYRVPYGHDPSHTWHGVNLVALLSSAERLGLPVAGDVDARLVARTVIAHLGAVPKARRDGWYHATYAEACLGLRDWSGVQTHIKAYAAAPKVSAFLLGSTLRQFTQLWELDKDPDERGPAIIEVLRARLASLPDGVVEMTPKEVKAARDTGAGQYQALLGDAGPECYRWWRNGLIQAESVAAVRNRHDQRRHGTGFLVKAGDFGLEPQDELLVLTNFHVVNDEDAASALHPDDAEVVFEVLDESHGYRIKEVVWSSGTDRHDAALLRLEQPVQNGRPVEIASRLPVAGDARARVYIIGHPWGEGLSFSFQNNKLIDHEGPHEGSPQIEGVCRVHYEAPTTWGSSGSPVFNRDWRLIALHHMGGKGDMPKLNGLSGRYSANQGIAITSIREAIQSDLAMKGKCKA